MNDMVESKAMPLTIYGLLARRHNTDNDYVCQVVNGKRKAIRGKGAAILADWQKIRDNFDDWITEYMPTGAMIVNMSDIHVSVYVQNGIARVYKRSDLKSEVDVKNMDLNTFKDFLNGIRIEFN